MADHAQADALEQRIRAARQGIEQDVHALGRHQPTDRQQVDVIASTWRPVAVPARDGERHPLDLSLGSAPVDQCASVELAVASTAACRMAITWWNCRMDRMSWSRWISSTSDGGVQLWKWTTGVGSCGEPSRVMASNRAKWMPQWKMATSQERNSGWRSSSHGLPVTNVRAPRVAIEALREQPHVLDVGERHSARRPARAPLPRWRRAGRRRRPPRRPSSSDLGSRVDGDDPLDAHRPLLDEQLRLSGRRRRAGSAAGHPARGRRCVLAVEDADAGALRRPHDHRGGGSAGQVDRRCCASASTPHGRVVVGTRGVRVLERAEELARSARRAAPTTGTTTKR